MALTRSQLLAGDSGQGTVLTGQVQGVKQGVGVLILPDGTINFDSTTATGVMRLNTPGAYNAYGWPVLAGAPAAGTILQSDGTGNLVWTANYVPTTGPTGAAQLPVGLNAQRPAAPATGEIRYNSETSELEFYDGANWLSIAAAPTPAGFVPQTAPTGAAVIPNGTTLDRPAAPVDGYTRYNSDLNQMEAFINGSWEIFPVSPTGNFVAQTIATVGTDSAVIPAGPSGSQQSAPPPAAGYLRYNSTEGQMEYYDGFSWILIGGSSTGSFVDKTVPTAPATATPNAVIPAGSTADRQTAPALVAGEFRFNTDLGELEVWSGTAWITVPSSPSGTFVQQSIPTAPAGATPVAIIPSGTTLQRQTAPVVVGGEMRFNTDTTLMEVFDGTNWVPIGAPPNAGLGLSLTGVTPNEILKFKMPEAAVPPTPGPLAPEAITGSMYYDINLGVLFIYYDNGGAPTWVQVPVGGGSAGAASLAEAAAGTLNTVYNSPETSVPKDASGMAGAALLPGSGAAYAGVPAMGMIRYNDAANPNPPVIEYYDATAPAWVPLIYEITGSNGITATGSAATSFGSIDIALPVNLLPVLP